MEKEVCLFLLLLGAGLAKPLVAGINNVPFVIEFENGAYHQVCTNSTCIEASHRMFENMDTSADPCDDFFQFACGRFVRNKVNFFLFFYFCIGQKYFVAVLRELLSVNSNCHPGDA